MCIFYITTTVHISRGLEEAIGATTHTYAVAKELTKLGHQVHIISERFEGDLEYEKIGKLHIHRLLRGIVKSSKEIKKSSWRRFFKIFKFIPNFLLGIKVAKLVGKYNCDLILERGHSLGVGAVASFLCGKPLILEIIDYIYSKFSALEAKSIIAYTKIFFSPWIRKKVSIVEAGFDPEIFYVKDLPLKYDICYAGSFKEWDGLEDLVRAARKILARFPEAKFILVGGGIREKKVKDLIRFYGLEKSFILTGHKPLKKVVDYINQSKICLAPFNVTRSKKGRFAKYGYYFSPLKIFEYMACGKPIVATNYSKIRSLVSKKSGLLFREGNIPDLTSKICWLLSRPKKIKEKGEYNKKLAQKYTWASVVKKINELIGE